MPPISPLCTAATGSPITMSSLTTTTTAPMSNGMNGMISNLNFSNSNTIATNTDPMDPDPDTESKESPEELKKQIQSLRAIINTKTVQLNMVIKHSEDKYADIHEKYRNMANELHDSWKHKYEILQRENEKLLNTLTFILN